MASLDKHDRTAHVPLGTPRTLRAKANHIRLPTEMMEFHEISLQTFRLLVYETSTDLKSFKICKVQKSNAQDLQSFPRKIFLEVLQFPTVAYALLVRVSGELPIACKPHE